MSGKTGEIEFAVQVMRLLVRAGNSPVPFSRINEIWGKRQAGDKAGLSRNALKARLRRLAQEEWVREVDGGYVPHLSFIALSVEARKAAACANRDLAELLSICS